MCDREYNTIFFLIVSKCVRVVVLGFWKETNKKWWWRTTKTTTQFDIETLVERKLRVFSLCVCVWTRNNHTRQCNKMAAKYLKEKLVSRFFLQYWLNWIFFLLCFIFTYYMRHQNITTTTTTTKCIIFFIYCSVSQKILPKSSSAKAGSFFFVIRKTPAAAGKTTRPQN